MSFQPDPGLAVLAQDLVDSLCDRQPVAIRPNLEWSGRMHVVAGRVFLRTGLIRLSIPLLTDPDRVRQTVLHEYAHLMVHTRWGKKVKPHGPEWKEAMLELGAEPRRTHAYTSERKPRRSWTYRCTACGFEFTRRRRLAHGREYRHIGCGGRIDPNGRPTPIPQP